MRERLVCILMRRNVEMLRGHRRPSMWVRFCAWYARHLADCERAFRASGDVFKPSASCREREREKEPVQDELPCMAAACMPTAHIGLKK